MSLSKVNILALQMDSPLCRQERSPNEFTHSAGNTSGGFAAQRATYTYETKGEQIRAEGCCSNCVKKCKGPKIKTPGINRGEGPWLCRAIPADWAPCLCKLLTPLRCGPMRQHIQKPGWQTGSLNELTYTTAPPWQRLAECPFPNKSGGH